MPLIVPAMARKSAFELMRDLGVLEGPRLPLWPLSSLPTELFLGSVHKELPASFPIAMCLHSSLFMLSLLPEISILPHSAGELPGILCKGKSFPRRAVETFSVPSPPSPMALCVTEHTAL